MRKIYIILIIITSIFVLSGCAEEETTGFDYLFENIDSGARDYIYEFDDEDKNTSLKLINNVKEIDFTSDSLYSIVSKFNAFYGQYIYVSEQYLIMLVYSYIFPTNEDIIEELTYITNLQLEYTQEYSNFLLAAFDSEHKDDLFANFSDDDLEYLAYQKQYFDDEYYELQSKNSTLEIEYNELINKEDTTSFQLAEKYVEMVEVNNKIARKLDYNNFFDYAYEVIYSRSYSYEDLTHINDAVRNELVPNFVSMVGDINSDAENLSFANLLIFSNLMTSKFSSFKYHLDDLAKYMGGDYLAHYNYLWNEGEYYFGNSKSNAGAFVASINDKLVAYFGPSPYNSLFTVTHEFGHYAAGLEDLVDGQKNSLDLAEFQSQANELMLASFMSQKQESSVYDFIAKYKLFECTTNVFVSTLVNDFEYTIYNTNTLTAANVEKIMLDTIESYDCVLQPGTYNEEYEGNSTLEYLFGDLSTVWTVTAAASPGYYISYGMSLFPSFEHFFVAQNDLDTAKTNYFEIMSAGVDLFVTLDQIGYNNPLDENVLSNLFKQIADYIAS